MRIKACDGKQSIQKSFDCLKSRKENLQAPNYYSVDGKEGICKYSKQGKPKIFRNHRGAYDKETR